MKQILSLATCLPLLAATLAAQTSVILPKGAATLNDNRYDSIWGSAATNVPVHVQHGYSTADLPNPVTVVRRLSWRRNNYYSNNIATSTSTIEIHMSHGASAPSAFVTTFATNEGGDRTKVFSGVVNWPAAAKGTGPAPFTHSVALSAPFVVTKAKGKSVVIDSQITKRTHIVGTNETFLIFDAVGSPAGSRSNNGTPPSGCKNSLNRYNSSLGYTTAGLTNAGGSWYVRYGNLIPNTAGITMISAFGVGQTWMNIRLPIDLTAAGAPGCTFNTGLDGVWIPFTTDASGQGRLPTLQIPAGLGGKAFFDQALHIDAQANSFGLVSCWSSKWNISNAQSYDVVTVYKTKDTSNSPTGSIRRVTAAIVELGT